MVGAYLAMQGRTSRQVDWAIVVIFCGALCLIGAETIDIGNAVYVAGPALRLLHGLSLHDHYMQYDLLDTLLAAGWFLLGFKIESFTVLVQISYIAALVALFFIGERLFRSRSLPFAMILAVLLVRVLGAAWEPWAYPQTGPLRVDMCFLPLLVIVVRGPHSLLVPVVCGVLIFTRGRSASSGR
jgi:hypothetical protein